MKPFTSLHVQAEVEESSWIQYLSKKINCFTGCNKDLGSADLTERLSFDFRYKRPMKAAETEAANRHISIWAQKGAGYTAEGSAGLTSNRDDVPQGSYHCSN